MAANSEVVRRRDPIRLPAWVVIGVALALAGALAVVSTSEGDTATAPASDSATVTERGSPGVRSDVEMAQLKAAVAQRFWAEQGGTAASQPTSTSTHPDIEALRAAVAQRFWAEQGATQGAAAEPEISYTADNGAPVIIDDEICGQCR